MANVGAIGDELIPQDQSFGVMTARRLVFYGVFVFLILMYLLIVPAFEFGFRDISVATMRAISLLSPIVLADIAFVGDLVPAILGAVIGGTAPKTANTRQLVSILLVAGLTYLLYVHMTSFFSVSSLGQPNDLKTEMAREGISAPTLQALANSSRNFTVFVISTLLGIRFSAGGSINIPLQRPEPEQQVGPAGPVAGAQQAPDLDPNVPKQDESDDDGAPMGKGEPNG